MNEALGVLAVAFLFAAFGVLRRRSIGTGCAGCHGGACNGACERAEGSSVDHHKHGGRA